MFVSGEIWTSFFLKFVYYTCSSFLVIICIQTLSFSVSTTSRWKGCKWNSIFKGDVGCISVPSSYNMFHGNNGIIITHLALSHDSVSYLKEIDSTWIPKKRLVFFFWIPSVAIWNVQEFHIYNFYILKKVGFIYNNHVFYTSRTHSYLLTAYEVHDKFICCCCVFKHLRECIITRLWFNWSYHHIMVTKFCVQHMLKIFRDM